MVFLLAYISNETVFATLINTSWKNDVSQLVNYVVGGSSYIYFIFLMRTRFSIK